MALALGEDYQIIYRVGNYQIIYHGNGIAKSFTMWGIIESFTAGMELSNHIPCGIIKSYTVGYYQIHLPCGIIKYIYRGTLKGTS